MTTPALEAGLRAGLAELALTLGDDQVAQLLAYQALIAKWNKVYNLTAVRDEQDMLRHHLLDSLAIVQPLKKYLTTHLTVPASLLDVGAGAGLPGVVLAICIPELAVTCIDTVGKKAAFIQQVAVSLRLSNLKTIHGRVESQQSANWGIVCSRAFASLLDFTQWTRAALHPTGVWLAMKGKHPEEELSALPGDIDMFHVEQLQVPGLNAERRLLWLRVRAR